MDQPVLRDVSLQASTMLKVYTSMLERLRYDATVYLDNLLQRAKRLNNQAVVKHCHRDKQTLEVAGATVAGRMVDALALTGLHTLSQHDCEGLDKELIEFHLSDLYHRSARSLQWANSEAPLSPEGVPRVDDVWQEQAERSTEWSINLQVEWHEWVNQIIETSTWESTEPSEGWIPNYSLLTGLHMTESATELLQESQMHNQQQTLSTVIEVLQLAHRTVADACGLEHLPSSHAAGMQYAALHVLATTAHRSMEDVSND